MDNIDNDKDQPLTLDIHEEMTNLTLDIVTGCVFGSGIMKDENVHETISSKYCNNIERNRKKNIQYDCAYSNY